MAHAHSRATVLPDARTFRFHQIPSCTRCKQWNENIKLNRKSHRKAIISTLWVAYHDYLAISCTLLWCVQTVGRLDVQKWFGINGELVIISRAGTTCFWETTKSAEDDCFFSATAFGTDNILKIMNVYLYCSQIRVLRECFHIDDYARLRNTIPNAPNICTPLAWRWSSPWSPAVVRTATATSSRAANVFDVQNIMKTKSFHRSCRFTRRECHRRVVVFRSLSSRNAYDVYRKTENGRKTEHQPNTFENARGGRI